MKQKLEIPEKILKRMVCMHMQVRTVSILLLTPSKPLFVNFLYKNINMRLI